MLNSSSLFVSPPRVLRLSTLAVLLIFCPHAHAATSEWQLVATHTEAAQASATWGARWLWALYAWRGRLFIGYGSFNGANPRAVIRAFDPKTNRFAAAPVFATNNEALGLFREVGGRLYVPTMDAHDDGASRQDFAVTTDKRGDVWTDHSEQLMYHIWDVATFDGKDVWFVGAAPSKGVCPFNFCTDAVAYRSTDGGKTFTEMIRRPSAAAGYELAWFSFACTFKGKLYLQTFYRFAPNGLADLVAPQSLVFDGQTWADGPDLLPERRAGESGDAPVVFDHHLIYLTRVPIARSYPNALPLWQNPLDLVTMDEHEHVTYMQIPGGAANFTVAGRYLYVLTRAGDLRRTQTLAEGWAQWEQLPAFPAQDPDPPHNSSARSLAVLNHTLYVGTTQAQLWRLDLTKIRKSNSILAKQ